jgi:uncharacterized protein
MYLSIVPLYAAILAVLYIFLSIRVIQQRRQKRVSIGDGDNLQLRRAIRVHANFSEYVPLTLILVMSVEMQQFAPVIVHGLCLMLITGRFCHADGVSQENENFRFRMAGMVLTFTPIAISAVLLMASFFMEVL